MQQFFTILGGMGTLATESYVRLLDKRTPIHRDQDYLNYLVVNHATVPDRTTWILDHSQPDPNEALIEDIKQQSLLNPAFFVLICNTAHYSFDKLQAATEIPILNMLQETVNEIKKIKTKSNQDMAFLLGSDETGKMDLVLFPKNINYLNNFKVGDLVYVLGTVARRLDKYQININRIRVLDDE